MSGIWICSQIDAVDLCLYRYEVMLDFSLANSASEVVGFDDAPLLCSVGYVIFSFCNVEVGRALHKR